jgi:predicted secreted hydrolase
VFALLLLWATLCSTAKDANISKPTPTTQRPNDLTTQSLLPPSFHGFEFARPGYPWSFPRDTGAHPDYQTEWWYYTGHLFGPKGEAYGYELTFFRTGILPPSAKRKSAWAAHDLLFAHFAVTDPNRRQFSYDERIERGALDLASASTTSQNVHVERWFARLEGSRHHLSAEGKGWKIDLTAMPLKPLVLHGNKGFSPKGSRPGNASQYYSYTRLKTSGTLWRNGQPMTVSGESWMDHEFSSGSLDADEAGWDWFSLQLNDGEETMLYRMRRKDGSADPHSGGTWVRKSGSSVVLKQEDYTIQEMGNWTSPKTGITYPSQWKVSVPSQGLQVEIEPILADQELVTSKSTGVTYWEGAVEIRGWMRNRPVRGRGYVELTGYGKLPSGRR